MSARDHLSPQEFTIHAGKYAISNDPKRWNHVEAHNLDEQGKPAGNWIGWLSHDAGGIIGNIHVREGYRRQGIATAMLNYAQIKNPDLTFEHSDSLTGDGLAFAKARPLKRK